MTDHAGGAADVAPADVTAPDTATARQVLEQHVLAEQAALQHLTLRSAMDDLLSLPLTMVQLKCLLVVLADGGSTGSALGARLGVSAPTISGVVERLVEAGFLQRRPHPGDRRVVLLQATELSMAWADGMARNFQVRSAEVTAQLSSAELRHLAIGTAALRRVLERESSPPPGP